jgi:hypothetical protein
MTITLRQESATGATTKGSSLTHAELDNNFVDLLGNKIKAIDVRGDTGTQLVGQSLSNEILNVTGGTGITTTVTSDSAGQARITITNNQNEFVPASPGEIGATTPADASFLNLNVKSASSTVKELRLHDQDNSNYVGFKSPTSVSTNKVYVLPATDGSPTHVLQTDGSGNLSWVAGSSFAPASPGEIGATTPDIGNFTTLKVKAANDLRLYDTDSSNYVGFKSPSTVTVDKIYTLPSTDGTNNQVLTTNGSGTLSWTTSSSGLSDIVNDTTPQLGGSLDVNGNSIVSVSNGNITLAPNGTGDVHLVTDAVRIGDLNEEARISTYGTGNLVLTTNEGNDPDPTITIGNGANANITLAPTGTGKVIINGTLQVDGTTTTINSTTVTVDDPIITLGGDTAPGSDDNKDRGVEFRWHNGSAAKVGFFGYDDSTGYLTFIPDATNTSEVFSGTQGDIQAANFRGALVGNASTATTLETTRAIYGNNFNGSAALTQVIASTYGGTGNGFTKFSGPTTAERTFTLPDASSTIVVQGGALGTPASGNLTSCTADGTAKVGYRVLPAVGTKSGSYTLAVGDVGEYVQVASGGSITIPNSTFSEGDVIVIANNHTAAITITCTITDAYIAGTDVDKATVSLATRGVCNILFLSGTRCIITGNVS